MADMQTWEVWYPEAAATGLHAGVAREVRAPNGFLEVVPPCRPSAFWRATRAHWPT